jgi:hypothetical protein
MLIFDFKLDCSSVTEQKHYYFRNGTIYGEVLRLTVGAYGEMCEIFTTTDVEMMSSGTSYRVVW